MAPNASPLLSPLGPTAIDRSPSSAATVVSWACLTNPDRGDLSANGWTIKREPCLSTPVRNGTASVTAAATFAPAPTNLRATQSGATVQVDWDQPPGASAWQLEVGSSPGLSNIAVLRLTTTSLTVTGVAGGTYYIRVRSAPADFSDVSEPSNEITLYISGCSSGCCVGAPQNFSALVNGNTVMLSWSPQSGATSYVLGVGTASHQPDLGIFDTGSAATTLQATAPNGRFYARVHAKTPFCLSGPSNEIIIVVPSPPVMPAAPVADFRLHRSKPSGVCSYRGCSFDATPSTGTSLTYFWDFADGSTGSGLFVTHVYARPPFYRQMTVVLTVTDAFGRSDTKARNIYLDPNY